MTVFLIGGAQTREDSDTGLLRAGRSSPGSKVCEFRFAIRCPRNPPPALRCLREKDPSAASLGSVPRGLGDYLCDFLDKLLLALTGQCAWRRYDLNPNGSGRLCGCCVNRMRVQPVNKGGGVVQVERTRGRYTLSSKDSHSQLVTELAVGARGEQVRRRVDVYHRHDGRLRPLTKAHGRDFLKCINN